ncbi:hypothetical protein [Nocardia altamirensis]|uniref:hypothetical protein n=1 Tax=Nocardia altamirensis TaxID=472158 RepID=UPI0014356209|nr:hypothetical protein [Nocardia altamirensis]
MSNNDSRTDGRHRPDIPHARSVEDIRDRLRREQPATDDPQTATSEDQYSDGGSAA